MPPRPKKSSSITASNTFTNALKFVATICKDHGAINETHAHINNGWVTAFNGTLSIGHKTDNTIHCCPQIKLTIEALSKCGQNIAITQLENRLSIKSDKFRALIPCIATDLLAPASPDKPICDIDNRLKDALSIAGELPNEIGQRVYNWSVLLHQGSVISSMGGTFILEYWHGLNLPPLLSIPKALCTVLGKINKKLTRFGFSLSSITIHFEDESWVKSQLYVEQWPMINVFECVSNMQQFPPDFWQAVAAVSPFGEGICYFHAGHLASHQDLAAGASFEMTGLPTGLAYPVKQLALLKPWATHVDFAAQGANGPMLLAMGKNVRAVIAGIRQ